MAVKALKECPRVHERYFFWTAQGTVETARKKWSEALAKIFRDAKVKSAWLRSTSGLAIIHPDCLFIGHQVPY